MDRTRDISIEMAKGCRDSKLWKWWIFFVTKAEVDKGIVINAGITMFNFSVSCAFAKSA